MNTSNDPILAQLQRIEAKQDIVITKQEDLEQRLDQIGKECKRTALVSGATAGGVAGGLVSVVIELIRLKLGG